MSDLKINFPNKLPQGFNVMSNEARMAFVKDVEAKTLESMNLPRDTFEVAKNKAKGSKISQLIENVKGSKILSKRNAMIAGGIALIGVAAGVIAKHIHNKNA